MLTCAALLGTQSQSTANLATLSQLPSPFFDEFVNMLPISYSRPINAMPGDDLFGQSPRGTVFDNGFLHQDPTSNFYSNSILPYQQSMPTSNLSIGITAGQSAPSVSGFSPASASSYSNVSASGAKEGRQGSYSSKSGMLSSVDQNINGFVHGPNQMAQMRGSVSGPSTMMKRPWYET
jgi:hypothetical protein